MLQQLTGLATQLPVHYSAALFIGLQSAQWLPNLFHAKNQHRPRWFIERVKVQHLPGQTNCLVQLPQCQRRFSGQNPCGHDPGSMQGSFRLGPFRQELVAQQRLIRNSQRLPQQCCSLLASGLFGAGQQRVKAGQIQINQIRI